MDGEWQIGSKTPMEYARIACETAKMMKWTDPSIELVACGSSSPGMKTFGEWERTVLREAYEHIDYISLHNYYGNPDNDSAAYLGSSLVMDKFIKTVVDICDEIKAEKNSDKTVNLSFDEWNVWFHSNDQDKKIDKWQIAPPLLEDIYNLEDALVVGSLLITLLKHSDRVKMACLAQLVNVIAPIMTVTGGGIWLQTIYYPFMYTSLNGRGTAMETLCDCDTYNAGELENIPYVETIAIMSEDEKQVTIFAVNRSMDEECELELNLEGFEGFNVTKHVALEGNDLKACNSYEEPNKVAAVEKEIGAEVKLAPTSWNMVVMNK